MKQTDFIWPALPQELFQNTTTLHIHLLIVFKSQLSASLPVVVQVVITRRSLHPVWQTSQLMDHAIAFLFSQVNGQFKSSDQGHWQRPIPAWTKGKGDDGEALLGVPIGSAPLSGPLYPSALNMFEDSSRSNQSHWSLLIGWSLTAKNESNQKDECHYHK